MFQDCFHQHLKGMSTLSMQLANKLEKDRDAGRLKAEPADFLKNLVDWTTLQCLAGESENWHLTMGVR